MSHGLGEHVERYQHVSRFLAGPDCRLTTLVFDYRGHGRSPGARGSVGRYEELAEDLEAALALLEAMQVPGPMFGLGHSQGGLLLLQAAIRKPGRLAGMVLSNPALALAIKVPAWKKRLASVLRAVAPRWAISGAVPVDWLSTHPEYARRRAADRLVHSRICAHIYFGMQAVGASIRERPDALKTRTLLVLGPNDRVTDVEAIRAFAREVGRGLVDSFELPGAAHEPLNDHGFERAFERIAEWIDRIIPGG